MRSCARIRALLLTRPGRQLREERRSSSSEVRVDLVHSTGGKDWRNHCCGDDASQDDSDTRKTDGHCGVAIESGNGSNATDNPEHKQARTNPKPYESTLPMLWAKRHKHRRFFANDHRDNDVKEDGERHKQSQVDRWMMPVKGPLHARLGRRLIASNTPIRERAVAQHHQSFPIPPDCPDRIAARNLVHGQRLTGRANKEARKRHHLGRRDEFSAFRASLVSQ
jgi:hypothetical protein